MRSFKQISDQPPAGTRSLFISMGVAVAFLGVSPWIFYSSDLFRTMPEWAYFAFSLLGLVHWVALLLLALWAARTYASYLPWLVTSVLALVSGSLASAVFVLALLAWSSSQAPMRAWEVVLQLIPYNPFGIVIPIVIVHVAFFFRRLPLLPKLVNTDPLTICRRCHYDLAGLSPGAVCPECGTQDPSTPVLGAYRPKAVAAARLGRSAGRSLAAIVAITFLTLLIREEVSYHSTMKKYAALTPAMPASVTMNTSMNNVDNSFSVRGVRLNDPRLGRYCLIVGEYWHAQQNPSAAMRNSLSRWPLVQSGHAIGLGEVNDAYGMSHGEWLGLVELIGPDPVLVLTPQQYQHLIVHGMPASLITAFQSYLQSHNPSADPFTNMFAQMAGQANPANQSPPIDLDDHFPIGSPEKMQGSEAAPEQSSLGP